MDICSKKYYELKQELDQCDYFECENYQNMLLNIKAALKSSGIIALTGIVGIGKTVTLRKIQQAVRGRFRELAKTARQAPNMW